MAEIIGLAASIAGLVQIAGQITKLSYSYITDIKNASRTQKQYLNEVSAFTDVLFRVEDGMQEVEASGLVAPRPPSLTAGVIDDCRSQLSSIHSELEKRLRKFIWPFQEKELKKHIDTLHRFRAIFSDLVSANILITTNATHREVQSLAQSQERQNLLSLLPKPDRFFKSRPLALSGTGQWFLDCDTYRTWLCDPPSVLWCYGAPGVGKSLLASIAIDDLLANQNERDPSVIYYFCDWAARDQQQSITILEGILRQIIEQGDVKVISNLKEYSSDPRKLRSLKDISTIIAKAFSLHDNPFLVIDALDELNNSEGLLPYFQSFVDAGCRVLVTSRDIPSIRSKLHMASSIEVKPSVEDLEAFVISRFQESEFCDEIEECRVLIDTVISKSNNIFLLTKLVVDELLELTTIRQMRKALESVPSKLDQAFESSLQRIDAQPKAKRQLAHRLIGWIISAERRMKMEEILHAFAVEEGTNEIDPENVANPDRLLRLCVGLVTLDSKNKTLSMVHTSAYEFFSRKVTQEMDVQIDMAKTSLLYLCTKPFTDGPCSDVKAMEERLRMMPFLSYASHYWGKHIPNRDIENSLVTLILEFLENSSLRSSGFQALQHRTDFNDEEISTSFFNSIPTDQEPLHVAAYWNLVSTTLVLIPKCHDISHTDSQNWTPLHWACSQRHLSVVEVLVKSGANINARDVQSWTPIFWAAFTGDLQTVKFLLANHANHLARSELGWTALHWAISRGELAIVETLLEHHAHYIKENVGRPKVSVKYLTVSEACQFVGADALTPVEIAAESGDSQLFDLLTEHLTGENSKAGDEDFNQIWSNEKFDTPVVYNSWRTMTKAEYGRGPESIIGYIEEPISKSSDADKRLVHWKTKLLKAAIRDSKLSAVRLLIFAGADVNNPVGACPLHVASYRKDPRFAQVLLENGADPACLDTKGQTALHSAIINGFIKTITVLLDHEAGINTRVGHSTCRGYWPITYGRVSKRFKAESTTPLMLACGIRLDDGHDSESLGANIIQLLLSRGADPLLQDDNGMSALHYAAMRPSLSIIRMLLDAGANVNLVNNDNETPLYLLAKYSTNDHDLDKLAEIVKCMMPSFGAEKQSLSATSTMSSEIGCLEESNSSKDSGDPAHSDTSDGVEQPNEGSTPVILSLRSKCWKLSQLLIMYGAEIPKNLDLRPIFQDAIKDLNSTIVSMLMKYKPPNDGLVIVLVRAICLALVERPSESTELHESFESILACLISLGADVRCEAPESGDTAIIIASRETSNSSVIQALLNVGADPYDENLNAHDSFVISALSENISGLRCLISNAMKAPKSHHWISGFTSTWLEGSDDIASLCFCLKEYGLIDRKNRQGRTLLHFAAEAGNCALIAQLLEHRADVDILDDQGWLPVHHAGFLGHADAVKLLFPIPDASVTAMPTIIRSDILTKRNQSERTMLHVAIENNDTSLASHLLHLGANIAIPMFRHYPPYPEPLLHFAAYKGFGSIVSELLSFGADVEVTPTSNTERVDGWRPLHIAACRGHIGIVQSLISAKADVRVPIQTWKPTGTRSALRLNRNEGTWQPLHLATMMGYPEIVRLLLENGADVHATCGRGNESTGHGLTAIHIALDTNDVNDRNGESLDHGRLEIARMLVERGADVAGVANHLKLHDVLKFKGYEDLWDTLRAGISEETSESVVN